MKYDAELFNELTIKYVKMILAQLDDTLQDNLLNGKPIRAQDIQSMISFIETLFFDKEENE
jgi:predicted sulfurtransferase